MEMGTKEDQLKENSKNVFKVFDLRCFLSKFSPWNFLWTVGNLCNHKQEIFLP